MRALIVFESMFGNTHHIADSIAAGLASVGEVTVASVDEATPELVDQADLLVVGGPTHAHGMSRPKTRADAIDLTEADNDLELDPAGYGEGLREWFDTLGRLDASSAAFDTRFDTVPMLTGRASKGISKRLKHHGCHEVINPKSFFVERGNHLAASQLAEATAWGHELATVMTKAEAR